MKLKSGAHLIPLRKDKLLRPDDRIRNLTVQLDEARLSLHRRALHPAVVIPVVVDAPATANIPALVRLLRTAPSLRRIRIHVCKEPPGGEEPVPQEREGAGERGGRPREVERGGTEGVRVLVGGR